MLFGRSVYVLREDGYDVVYATEELRGASDSEILAKAFDDERMLLTEDKDFGELVHRLSRPSRGIIFLRFPESVRLAKIRRLRDLLQQHQERLEGSYVVLEPVKTRIRRI